MLRAMCVKNEDERGVAGIEVRKKPVEVCDEGGEESRSEGEGGCG